MRIAAFASFPAWPTKHGGSMRVAEITRELARRGHSVCLFALSEEPMKRSRVEGVFQVPLVRTGASASRNGYSLADVETDSLKGIGIARLAARHWADVVLCFQIYMMRHLPDKCAPIVLDMMDVESEVKAHAFPSDVRLREEVLRMEGAALARASHFITPAREDGVLLETLHGAPELGWSIVANGAEVPISARLSREERTRAKEKLGLPTDKPLALFFSSGHPPNVIVGFRTLQIARQRDDLYFLMAGAVSWPLKHGNPSSNVHLVYDVSREQRGQIYAAADIGLNILEEQLPGSDVKVLDYMSHGIPVVSTERGVRGHDMQPHVHYMPTGDDPGHAISRVGYEEELPARLVENGLEFVKSRTWLKAVDAAEKALQLAASKKWAVRASIPEPPSREPLAEYRANAELAWSTPTEIAFDLTNDCHLRCTHCYRTYQHNTPTYLPLEVFQKVPQRFYDYVKQIELSGMGEPMLHPEWDSILEYISARTDARITFNTSLTIWNELKLRRMVALGTSPAISIDAAKKATFERIRQRARHERVFGGLRRLMEIAREEPNPAFHARVQWTLYRHNVEELAEFIEIAAEMGVPEVRVQPLAPHQPEMVQWVCDPKDPATEEHIANALRAAEKHGVSLAMHETLRFTQELEDLQRRAYHASETLAKRLQIHDHPSPHGCSFPWTQMNIDSDGYVVACCFSDYRLGNLHHEDLDSIWNNGHFQLLRREVNQVKLCTYCVDSPSGGVCCPRIQYLRTDKNKTHWLQESGAADAVKN